MNRKGDNSFNQDEEKAKYEVGMIVYLKKKQGTIIYINEHYITVQFEDGIKESFVWHELFEKYDRKVEDADDDFPEDTVELFNDENPDDIEESRE